MKRTGLVIAIALLMSGPVEGYELDTHAWMAKESFSRSLLSPTVSGSTELYRMLGWERMDATKPFNLPIGIGIGGGEVNSYYDLPGPWQPGNTLDYARAVDYFEQRRMPAQYRSADATLGDQPWLRFESWLMRGAIREDDLGQVEYPDGIAPDIDPHGEITRVLRHFYNPITGDTPFLFEKSTNWALGTVDALAVPPATDIDRRNHFSWADARRAYYHALTFKRFNPQTADPQSAQDDFSRRYLFWGTTLKSLGHVLHLLEDAAQPQHSRVDAHNHSNFFPDFTNAPLRRRVYEIYTNLRILEAATSPDLPYVPASDEQDMVTLLGQPLNRGIGDPMPVGNYPIPQFSLPVEFFSTKTSDADPSVRRGLADYSNRGFFSEGTLFADVDDLPLPPNNTIGTGYDFIARVVATRTGNVRVTEAVHTVPDSVAPTYVDHDIAGTGNKAPLFAFSLWDQFGQQGNGTGRIIALDQFRIHANMLTPRTVAYGAGMLNYFFRGRLEVIPTAQNALAVLNQGEPHTVDATGYPRRPNGDIFGFEKVRVRVRNVSDAIVESGSASPPIPQTSGSGTLVAVARYHRNACYKPDMSGERVIAYAPAPSIGTITEPTCSGSTPQRTSYQEISISAPLTVSSVADLPGGEGVGGPATPVEKTFDFSADPIPVNATDLFIQVVYRGQLGEEPGAIAVGTYDVREPTFVGIYNNTDYYWNSGLVQWIPHNQTSLYPWQNVDFLRVCTGASTNSRWAYYAEPIAGMPPLGVPSPTPGAVRLAIVFAVPNPPTQQFAVRVTPVMAGSTNASERSSFTRGAIRQGNKELINPAALGAPQYCTFSGPTGTDYWCNDPIHRRRGMRLGHVVAPIYYDTGFGNTGSDVDSVPLPTFTGLRQHDAGTIKYNDASLSNCPLPPTSATATLTRSVVELLEVAADLGISVD